MLALFLFVIDNQHTNYETNYDDLGGLKFMNESTELEDPIMKEMDIVIQFAKLWGMEIASLRTDKSTYDMLESYDSVELLALLLSWKNKYLKDEEEDLVEFFNKQIKDLKAEVLNGKHN